MRVVKRLLSGLPVHDFHATCPRLHIIMINIYKSYVEWIRTINNRDLLYCLCVTEQNPGMNLAVMDFWSC